MLDDDCEGIGTYSDKMPPKNSKYCYFEPPQSVHNIHFGRIQLVDAAICDSAYC